MRKKVYEYDHINGHYITEYSSISEAAKIKGCDESTVRKAAGLSKSASAFGSKWSFHKAASIYDIGELEQYIDHVGVNPEEVTGAKIQEDKDGNNRISIEIKKKRIVSEEDQTLDMILHNKKQLQRKQDELRVVNKHFREYARVENTLTALNEALITQLSESKFRPTTYEHFDKEGSTILVQVSDTHFNELVNLPDNAYDFTVGSKRLQKYAHKIKKVTEAYKSSNIVVAFTGDVINSDRRLDEMMNQATNRTKAAILATEILYQFLQDINKVANLAVVGVSGNESRIKEEYGMSAMLMSDNYDFLVYNMLKVLFRDKKGVRFITGDPVEQVININNSNILIAHGTGYKEGQAFMQQVFGKYAAKGILLDYAIFGHVHFANVTDIYSRSGSLVGNNSYSDRGLNLVTKASQNLHIIEKDGTIDSMKVGLQFIGDYKGYEIDSDINAYNPILSNNLFEKETIVQIVI